MALTKQDELLKYQIDENLNTPKIELIPQLIDTNLHMCNPNCLHLDQDKIIAQHTKNTITTKTQLEKTLNNLYNIENYHTNEKTLNINLDLYQMEDY